MRIGQENIIYLCLGIGLIKLWVFKLKGLNLTPYTKINCIRLYQKLNLKKKNTLVKT